MFGSVVLEIAIGLAFVYILFSLVVSTISEMIAGTFRWRARNLKKAIKRLLPGKEASTADQTQPSTLVDSFYKHQLIRTLCKQDKRPPSYVSPTTFSKVVVDLIDTKGKMAGKRAALLALQADVVNAGDITAARCEIDKVVNNKKDSETKFDKGAKEELEKLSKDALLDDVVKLSKSIRDRMDRIASRNILELVNKVKSDQLKETLLILIRESGESVVALRAELESWFNDTMDRAIGWYKRTARIASFVIAAVVVIALNVDTIQITRQLAADSALRESIVKQAEGFSEQSRLAVTEAPDVPTEPQAIILPEYVVQGGGETSGQIVLSKEAKGNVIYVLTAQNNSQDDSADDDRANQKIVSFEGVDHGDIDLESNEVVVADGQKSGPFVIKTQSVSDVKIVALHAKLKDQPNPTMRTLLTVRPDPRKVIAELGLPITWQAPNPEWRAAKDDGDLFLFWMAKVLGLIVTIVAVSLGAPFWFDLLNKLISLRSSNRISTESEEKAAARKAKKD